MDLLYYMLRWLTALFLLYISTGPVVLASIDENALFTDLLEHKDYNTLVRPARERSEIIEVGFEMTLIQLITVDQRKQLMKTNIWLRLKWTDYRLSWDPLQYGNFTMALRVRPDKVWQPDIVLLNNADGKFEVSFKSNILVSPDGIMMWIPATIYKSSCTMDFKYFPFDEQRCNMSYGSWTYNGNEVKLVPYITDFRKVDLTDYEKSGTWDVVDIPGEHITHLHEGQNISRANYMIVLRRKTLFYTVNLILPCVLISMLSMVVFYLPATAGEKITMSVSVFLALIVYLQVIVSHLLPPSSLSLPLFAKYLLFTIMVDVCCIINTIISLNWSQRTPRTHVLSPAMRTFFFKYLAGFLRMRRPGDTQPQNAPAPPTAPRTSSVNELDLSDLHHMNCPYARMSTLQRHRVLEASSQTSYDNLQQEYSKAIEAVRFAAAHLKNEDDFGEVVDDWRYISLMFDRLLFYVYAIVTLIGTLSILMYAPHVFATDFNQQAFKREVAIERCCKELHEENPPEKMEDCFRNPDAHKC